VTWDDAVRWLMIPGGVTVLVIALGLIGVRLIP